MALKSRLKPSTEFSMASIADIVFLLLVFFMVTSSFVRQVGVKIDFPRGESTTQHETDVAITVTSDEKYMWNNEEIGVGMTREEKEKAVELKIDEYFTNTNNTEKVDSVIILRLDKEVKIGQMTPLVSKVAEHNGAVIFRTEK